MFGKTVMVSHMRAQYVPQFQHVQVILVPKTIGTSNLDPNFGKQSFPPPSTIKVESPKIKLLSYKKYPFH